MAIKPVELFVEDKTAGMETFWGKIKLFASTFGLPGYEQPKKKTLEGGSRLIIAEFFSFLKM